MPAVTLSTLVGAPRSMTDALYLTHAPATPLSSRMRKGQSISQIVHIYKVGREGTPVDSATPDGQPPAPAGGKNPEYEVGARVGFFESTPRVGKFAKHKTVIGQTSSLAPKKNPGTGTAHLALAKAQHLQRIKFGIEKRMLSDGDSVPETATEADKFRGAGAWLQTGSQTDQPVPVAVRTPATQIYGGTLANFQEADLQTLLQARWTSTGVTPELVGLLGAALKTQVGTFNRRVPTVANFEAAIRYNGGSGKTIFQGVDIYEGDFGIVEFMPSFFVPSPKRGYIFDLMQAEMLPFGPGTEEEQLGNDGGGDALVIRAMQTWTVGDPRAHCKIKPSDEP